jgi:hypothetical protein
LSSYFDFAASCYTKIDPFIDSHGEEIGFSRTWLDRRGIERAETAKPEGVPTAGAENVWYSWRDILDTQASVVQ